METAKAQRLFASRADAGRRPRRGRLGPGWGRGRAGLVGDQRVCWLGDPSALWLLAAVSSPFRDNSGRGRVSLLGGWLSCKRGLAGFEGCDILSIVRRVA